MSDIIRFEVGKTYRAVGGGYFPYYYRVEKRTPKTVTLRQVFHGIEATDTRVRRIQPEPYDGAEWLLPNGSYSMAPVMSADDRRE